MNIPIASWRVLQGEVGRQQERERMEREARERRERRWGLVRAAREGFVCAWSDFWALFRNPWVWVLALVFWMCGGAR